MTLFYSVAVVLFAGGSLRAIAEPATAKKSGLHPGLPDRKPAIGKAGEKPVSSKAERDKVLCRVLQVCRNGFVACKARIKYPDQSEAWIIAKEECGAHYKVCIEKDFRGGEWLFTRWFHFWQLNCE